MGEAADLDRGLWPETQAIGSHYSVTEVLPQFLSLLQEHDIKATYFVEAWNLTVYPDAVRSIAAAGHEVGWHAWRHEAWGKLDESAERANFERSWGEEGISGFISMGGKGEGVVDQYLGFRPPGGTIHGDRTLKLCRQHALDYISPAAEDAAMISIAGGEDRIAVLPFRWSTVDAYYYMEAFGGLRRIKGEESEETLTPETLATRYIAEIDDAIKTGGYRSVLFHPFLTNEPRRLQAMEAVLDYVARKRDEGQIWLARPNILHFTLTLKVIAESTDQHDLKRASITMISDTAPTQPRCYFLELPKELRLQTYELLLMPRKITIRSYDTPSIAKMSDEEVAKTAFFALPPGDLDPQVLRVCHQIHGEAGRLLYSAPYLHLRPSFANFRRRGKAKDCAIDTTRLQVHRQLEKLRVDLVVTTGTLNEDIRHSQVLRGFYASLRAKHMRLSVRDREESSADNNSGLHPTLDGLVVLTAIWSKSAACGDLSVRHSQSGESGGGWRRLSGDGWADSLPEEKRVDVVNLYRRAKVFEELKVRLGEVTATGGRNSCDADVFSDEEGEEDSDEEAENESDGDSEPDNEE
ncbi:hypothetical protein LTR85_008027 [Meristemomyces frigidus]|nr:hypothetical protein LTR85_008027 [Meristemomyces frigidus]